MEVLRRLAGRARAREPAHGPAGELLSGPAGEERDRLLLRDAEVQVPAEHWAIV